MSDHPLVEEAPKKGRSGAGGVRHIFGGQIGQQREVETCMVPHNGKIKFVHDRRQD